MRLEPVASRVPRVPLLPALVLIVGLALVAVVQLLGSADLCHFHRLTGHPCPTCGSTRVVLALLAGDVERAAALNPLVFLGLVGLAALATLRLVGKRRLVVLTTRRRVRIATATLLLAVLANWAYLEATLPHTPVSRHAQAGATAP